jgi:hypothetical protein
VIFAAHFKYTVFAALFYLKFKPSAQSPAMCAAMPVLRCIQRRASHAPPSSPFGRSCSFVSSLDRSTLRLRFDFPTLPPQRRLSDYRATLLTRYPSGQHGARMADGIARRMREISQTASQSHKKTRRRSTTATRTAQVARWVRRTRTRPRLITQRYKFKTGHSRSLRSRTKDSQPKQT